MDLLALLFVVGICSSLTSGNDVKPAPPEDEDGSGDDEDFSGSGMDGFLVDVDGDGVFSTPVSSLVPAVTQLSTAQKPDIAVEEKTEEENVTQYVPTITPRGSVEDIVVVDPVGKEPFAEEGTTLEPTTQQASTVESVNDVKKHHHHHTTMPITSLPAEFDVDEETTTSPAEVEKPFVGPEETTTSTPDEGDLDDLVKEVTPTPEDSVKNVDQQETTSGLTSTSYAEKETTVGPEDIDDILAFGDSVEKTTVPDEDHTHKHHHHHTPHHHHHHHNTTTAVPLDGSDIPIEATEKPDYLEPEEDQQGEATTTQSSEDKHHHHHHKHHHHHTTTPGTTQSTVPEQFIVHSQEPKGRKVNVPPAEATSVVPVLSEDEEPVGSTVQYNHSVNPIQDEDTQDSTEETSGNGPMDGEDIFFEATAPVDNSERRAVPGDGSAGASQGIMERKELLAGIIAGGLAGLVFAASLVAFVLYRMKKKDEGSYSLEEPKQSNGGYQKPVEQREFYA